MAVCQVLGCESSRRCRGCGCCCRSCCCCGSVQCCCCACCCCGESASCCLLKFSLDVHGVALPTDWPSIGNWWPLPLSYTAILNRSSTLARTQLAFHSYCMELRDGIACCQWLILERVYYNKPRPSQTIPT